MKEYNGHRSWNAWNISLWIGNDESLYRLALDCIDTARHYPRCRNILAKATREFLACMGGSRTPDGAIYNALSVKLCLQGFLDD